MPALTLPSALRPLNEAGLHLADTEDRHPGGGGKRYVLTCDQSVFNKRLRSSLESSPDYPENAKKMAKAFTELLDSSDAAVKTALEPTVTQEEQSATARGKFQDAAIRLMLQVGHEVQPPLVKWLLDHLESVALNPTGLSDEAKADRVRSLLSQLCYLDKVVDGDAMARSLTRTLLATPAAVQREIVLRLPEMVDARHHPALVEPLKKAMQRSPGLTNYVLEACTALAIDSDSGCDGLDEVRQSLIRELPVKPVCDLPIIVKFLIDTMAAGDEQATVAELRDGLDLTSGGLRTQPPTSATSSQDSDTMTLRVLRNWVTSKRRARMSWLQALEQVRDQRPIDLMMTLVLRDLPDCERAVDASVRAKVRVGALRRQVVAKTLEQHSEALRDSFDALLAIAEALCESRELAIADFAIVLYEEAFLNFDPVCKQKIIAELIMKASGSVGMDTATKTLSHLVFNFPSKLGGCFALMLGTILDDIGGMELSQARIVFDLLSFLAYAHPDAAAACESRSLRDSLQMVIRKQVAAFNPALKRMGAVGVIMTVKNMKDSSNFDVATQLLERTWTTTRSLAADMGPGLFLDELSSTVAKTDNRKIIKWIYKEIASTFQGEFLCAADDGSSGSSLGHANDFMPSESQFGLCENGESDVALNLSALSVYSAGPEKFPPALKCKISRLLPHFRLLAATLRALGGSKKAFPLLTCPVIMPQQGVLDKFETLSATEKNVICTVLFFCANWFRELLNAFVQPRQDAVNATDEGKAAVLNRLKDLLFVQKQLSACLSAHPTFVPPAVLHLADTSSWQPPAANPAPTMASVARVANYTRGKGKGRGKKRKHDDVDDLEQATSQADRSHFKKEEKAVGIAVSLNYYAPFFRELDLDALGLISFNKVVIRNEPSAEEERENPKLRAADLLFLLRDLLPKLENCLTANGKTKKRPVGLALAAGRAALKTALFGNLAQQHSADDVARRVVGMIDCLLGHAEVAAKYFRNILEMNGAGESQTESVAELFSASTPDLLQCYELVFNALNVVLNWEGFVSRTNSPLLREALLAIAKRLPQGRAGKTDEEEAIAGEALKYVASLSDTILVVGCAEAHLKLVVSLARLSGGGRDASTQLARLARSYLKKSWEDATGAKEKGARFATAVETILRVYLDNADGSEVETAAIEVDNDDDTAPMDGRWGMLDEYMNELNCVLQGTGTGAASEKFPTFTKGTLNVHYRQLLHTVCNEAKQITISPTARTDEATELFKPLSNAVKLIAVLANATLCKSLQRPPYLAALLKSSKLFFEGFLKHGMIVMDKLFGDDQDNCMNMLKNLQICTRSLHRVLNHSKQAIDTTLAKQGPPIKRLLEQLRIRFKATLLLNDMADAYHVGVLKNRGLDGEVIGEEPELEPDDGTSDKASAVDSDDGEQQQEEEEEESAEEEDGEDECDRSLTI